MTGGPGGPRGPGKIVLPGPGAGPDPVPGNSGALHLGFSYIVFLIHGFFNTWLLAARLDLPPSPPLPSPPQPGGGGGLGRGGDGMGRGQAGQPATMY